MGMLVLIGLFFAMSIVRLIIWCLFALASERRFLIFPNLFEDVGFWDSFKPAWVWDEKKKPKKSKSSSSAKSGGSSVGSIQVPGQPPPASATTGSAAPQMNTSAPSQRNLAPRVEEVFDE
jgi:translocation protein SEC62